MHIKRNFMLKLVKEVKIHILSFKRNIHIIFVVYENMRTINIFKHPGGLGSIIHFRILFILLYGPRPEKTCLLGVANNTGADQPISAFVIHFLESIIYKLATGKISNF